MDNQENLQLLRAEFLQKPHGFLVRLRRGQSSSPSARDDQKAIANFWSWVLPDLSKNPQDYQPHHLYCLAKLAIPHPPHNDFLTDLLGRGLDPYQSNGELFALALPHWSSRHVSSLINRLPKSIPSQWKMDDYLINMLIVDKKSFLSALYNTNDKISPPDHRQRFDQSVTQALSDVLPKISINDRAYFGLFELSVALSLKPIRPSLILLDWLLFHRS